VSSMGNRRLFLWPPTKYEDCLQVEGTSASFATADLSRSERLRRSHSTRMDPRHGPSHKLFDFRVTEAHGASEACIRASSFFLLPILLHHEHRGGQEGRAQVIVPWLDRVLRGARSDGPATFVTGLPVTSRVALRTSDRIEKFRKPSKICLVVDAPTLLWVHGLSEAINSLGRVTTCSKLPGNPTPRPTNIRLSAAAGLLHNVLIAFGALANKPARARLTGR